MEPKDISEYWAPRFEGERVNIKDLVDKEIIIFAFDVRPSDYYEGREYAIIHIEHEGEKKICGTTAAAIIGSLKWLKERGALPSEAGIKAKVAQELSPKKRMQFKLAPTVEIPRAEKIEE